MRPKALNLQEDGGFLVRGHILYMSISNYIILYSFTWFSGQLAMAQAIMDLKLGRPSRDRFSLIVTTSETSCGRTASAMSCQRPLNSEAGWVAGPRLWLSLAARCLKWSLKNGREWSESLDFYGFLWISIHFWVASGCRAQVADRSLAQTVSAGHRLSRQNLLLLTGACLL